MHPSNASLGDLAGGLAEDVERVARLELSLARQEISEMARENAVAFALLAGGGLLALVALLVALPVLIISLVHPHWVAALAWFALYAVAGGGMVFFGRQQLNLQVPPRTLASLKETREWALRLIKSPKS